MFLDVLDRKNCGKCHFLRKISGQNIDYLVVTHLKTYNYIAINKKQTNMRRSVSMALPV